MTIKEFQVNLDNKIKNIKIFTEPLRIAAFSATALIGERIFDEGKTASGSEIGDYSTKPIYINPDTFFKKGGIGVPMGKPKEGKARGETTFKTGKKKGQRHKTKYLAGGYKELRDKVGRQSSFVDLKLSGELRQDFSNQKGENAPAEPRKINELEYQVRLDKQINQKKREGMDEKYGTIFTPSESEKEKFFEVIGFEFRKRFA